MNQFRDHCSSLGGGNWINPDLPPIEAKEKRAHIEKIVLMVERVLKLVLGNDVRKERLELLLNLGREKDDVILKLKEQRKLHWSTTRNYVIAIGHFLTFLSLNKELRGDWCTDTVMDNLRTVQKACLKGVSLKKKIEGTGALAL